MKRKRTGEPASPAPADSAAASGSESGVDELETGPPLDSFYEDLAQPVEALNAAVNSATAFLQPSEQLSALARAAARVSCTFLYCIVQLLDTGAAVCSMLCIGSVYSVLLVHSSCTSLA